jgi:hypothetical protein
MSILQSTFHLVSKYRFKHPFLITTKKKDILVKICSQASNFRLYKITSKAALKYGSEVWVLDKRECKQLETDGV